VELFCQVAGVKPPNPDSKEFPAREQRLHRLAAEALLIAPSTAQHLPSTVSHHYLFNGEDPMARAQKNPAAPQPSPPWSPQQAVLHAVKESLSLHRVTGLVHHINTDLGFPGTRLGPNVARRTHAWLLKVLYRVLDEALGLMDEEKAKQLTWEHILAGMAKLNFEELTEAVDL
jgi:hypothetical protein